MIEQERSKNHLPHPAEAACPTTSSAAGDPRSTENRPTNLASAGCAASSTRRICPGWVGRSLWREKIEKKERQTKVASAAQVLRPLACAPGSAAVRSCLTGYRMGTRASRKPRLKFRYVGEFPLRTVAWQTVPK